MRELRLERIRAETYHQRGRHLFNAERYEEAMASFKCAVKSDPTFLRAFAGIANSLTMLGRYGEAITLCDDVLAREPTFAVGYTARGTARHRMGDREGALEDYRRGVDLAPDDSLVYYNFACYWALLGDEGECKANLTRALELDPREKAKAAVDGDFVSFRDRPWFKALVTPG
jgi:tetratricopeptide (TPR) repeat protein